MLTNRHPLHSGTRVWRESNCYLDLWIGALHAHGLDPHAMLLCAIAPQFEIDQWTFCKPTAGELARLYGIRVEELNIWHNTLTHIESQVHAGRMVLVEADAYYLPDTTGVTFEQYHQKTTIGISAIHRTTGAMEYFHNAGHFEMHAEHAANALTLGGSPHGLPPFAEFADFRHAQRFDKDRSVRIARALAAHRLAIMTNANAFDVWAEHAELQLISLAQRDIQYFHAWAFATIRQAGAMAELSSIWCRWMQEDVRTPHASQWRAASEALYGVAQKLAAQQFRLARVVQRGTRADFPATLTRCGQQWQLAYEAMRIALQDEPVQDEPVQDEPVQDEPVQDEPVPDNPVPDNPVPDNPVPDNPVPDEPVDVKPQRRMSRR